MVSIKDIENLEKIKTDTKLYLVSRFQNWFSRYKLKSIHFSKTSKNSL